MRKLASGAVPMVGMGVEVDYGADHRPWDNAADQQAACFSPTAGQRPGWTQSLSYCVLLPPK